MKVITSIATKAIIKFIRKKYGVDLYIVVHDAEIKSTEKNTQLCVNAELCMSNSDLDEFVEKLLK